MAHINTSQEKRNEINYLSTAQNRFENGASSGILRDMREHERLTQVAYAIDAARVRTCIGFEPPAGQWLPLDILRNIFDPCRDLIAAMERSDQPRSLARQDIIPYPAAQKALADVYGWLAWYRAARCLVPLDGAADWPCLSTLIQDAHIAVPGAPPLGAVELHFIGKAVGPRTQSAPGGQRASRGRRQEETHPELDPDIVRQFEEDFADLGISMTIDPRLVDELLRYHVHRDFRAPVGPVWDLLNAEMKASVYCDFHGSSSDRDKDGFATDEGVFQHEAVQKAVSDLYALLTLFGATRCPLPLGPKIAGARERISFFIKNAHEAVPGAPPLSVELPFVGKTPPD